MSSLFALLVHKETSNTRLSLRTPDAVKLNKKKILIRIMWNRCVVEWLKNLRYNIEYYDEAVLSCEAMDTEVVSSVSSYENLWECSTKDQQFDLKYGEVCRLSINFSDKLESLLIQPVVYENLGLDVSDDVIMWKDQLRHTYYGEEENFFEGEDLITEFGEETKAAVDNSNKPGSFPVFEGDEEVQIRIRGPSIKVDRPKTCNSSVNKKKPEDSFDFRVPCYLEIGTERCVKIRPKETLRMTNGQLEILDAHGMNKMTLKSNLKKGTKLISKKEVEMIDNDKTIYRFHFESTRDAKLFVEMEKSRPSTPKDKSASPFSITQLLKLLKKRSSRDLLESKGIIRNEPIFGNTLQELCNTPDSVPEVITRIVKLIEEPENITSLGLYRASANLAIVQNIRCEINCGRWEILEKYKKEVDVLAGTLKLFFRELKEPLIPYQTYQLLLAAIRGSSTSDSEIGSIVDSLPEPNRATLLYVIQHLLNVCRHKNENKMDIHNISICWGPSLIMFPDNCVDLVTQTTEFTAITEHLLEYYRDNFGKTENKIPKTADFVHQAVRKMIELIELNLDEEGIYRKSGSTTKIDRIMRQLDLRNLNDLERSKSDTHELCCVLKKFLGSLKEPLVPNHVFDRYCDICDKSDEQLTKEVRDMIEQIPRKDVLFSLLQHLRKVIRHEKNNKMSMTVMTDMWMTTLANPDVQQYKTKMQKFSGLFQILINLNELPDLLPESEPRTRESRYDNVQDDINTDGVHTKL